MRWFKHLLGNSEGDSQFVSELVIEFGGDGYYVFYRTLEVMCVEFDIQNPAENIFFADFFYQKFFKISRKKIKIILNRCSEKYKNTNGEKGIFFKEEGRGVSLKCCRLKTLADEYTKKELSKMGKESGETPDKLPTTQGDIELDLDIDLDKDNNTSSFQEEKPKRKDVKFSKEDMGKVTEAYKRIKKVLPINSEWLPIQQAIKTMFMNDRKPEEIIGCMEWLEKESGYDEWTINTVKIKMPDFVSGVIRRDDDRYNF